jgi:ACS family D-galactonate transporter-like MFS transporter
MERDTARSWLIIITLGFAVSIAFMDRVLLSVATPKIMTEFGLSGTVAGLMLAAFFWSYTFMQIPSGLLVDRYGTKRVLAAGYALWSLSCVVIGLGSSFVNLVICRLGLGIGEGPVFPCAYRLVSTAFTERNRGLASAVYGEGSKVGPAIGAPLAGVLIASYGWHNMFIIVGLASLFWLIPWLMVAPTQAEDVGPSGVRMSIGEFFQLLKSREILGSAVGYFGYLYVFYVYITWLPGYLILERGFSTLDAGWLSAIPFAAQFVFALIGGGVADWFIHRGYSATVVRKTAIGVGLTIALAIIPAAFVASSAATLILFAVSTAGLGICNPNMLAVPSGLAPENRGGIVGAVQNMGGNFGGILAPTITGSLYDATQSFATALVVAGSMLSTCAIGYLWMIRRIEPIKLKKIPENTVLATT